MAPNSGLSESRAPPRGSHRLRPAQGPLEQDSGAGPQCLPRTDDDAEGRPASRSPLLMADGEGKRRSGPGRRCMLTAQGWPARHHRQRHKCCYVRSRATYQAEQNRD